MDPSSAQRWLARALSVAAHTATLLYYCRWRKAYREVKREVLDGLPIEEFNYEDDLMDDSAWQSTPDRAFRHLGIDPAPVSSDLLRINAAPLAEVIENYAEVQAALRSTPYESLLEQDV